jgi:hypothetical protein
MRKALPWILFSLTLVMSLYFFVLLLNAGSAISDARSEESYHKKNRDFVLKILRKDWIGRSKSEVNDLANEFKDQGEIVKLSGDTFMVGGVVFETRDGIVKEVRFNN